MKQYQYITLEKSFFANLKMWLEELNKKGSEGYRLVQILSSPAVAIMEKEQAAPESSP